MGIGVLSRFGESNQVVDDDLSQAVSLFDQIHDYQRHHFPFLDDRLGFDLMLKIGHRQVTGMPMNLTEILDANLSSISTVVRHLAKLEKLGVLFKRKAAYDKRVVHYYLAASHLEKMRELFSAVMGEGTRPADSRARGANDCGYGESHVMHASVARSNN